MVRGQFSLGAIVQGGGQLSRGSISERSHPGGNYPGDNCPKTYSRLKRIKRGGGLRLLRFFVNNFRSSFRRCSLEKGVIKYFLNFT